MVGKVRGGSICRGGGGFDSKREFDVAIVASLSAADVKMVMTGNAHRSIIYTYVKNIMINTLKLTY